MGAVLAGALLFAVGRMTAGGGRGLSQKTQENLSTAMHGEAFAYAKYMLYAKHAQQNGNEELSKLFQTAANIERFQHFAEEAQLAGLVGNDADNLKDAIKGESYLYVDNSEGGNDVGLVEATRYCALTCPDCYSDLSAVQNKSPG